MYQRTIVDSGRNMSVCYGLKHDGVSGTIVDSGRSMSDGGAKRTIIDLGRSVYVYHVHVSDEGLPYLFRLSFLLA